MQHTRAHRVFSVSRWRSRCASIVRGHVILGSHVGREGHRAGKCKSGSEKHKHKPHTPKQHSESIMNIVTGVQCSELASYSS